jgi:hypothetical protein
MPPRFVADGPIRWRENQELTAQFAAAREAILARYSDQLVGAGWFRRCLLRAQSTLEICRERKRVEPSPYSLY